MDTVDKLSAYAEAKGSAVRIIGIPKTIDNDLCVTDHTPGFGSAAKYVASTFLEIAHDTYIYKVKSVTIVEVMGRDAVMLTLLRTCNDPYTATYGSSPVCDIANLAKEVPASFINERGNDVTEEMVSYLRPLIQGEMPVVYENGLPQYLAIGHLLS